MADHSNDARGCLAPAVRYVRFGLFAIFLFFLLGTLSARERPDSTLVLGTLVLGTEVSRDVFKARPPAYVEYSVGLALVVGSAAYSGHWLLAIVVVAMISMLRLPSWYVNRQSKIPG